MHLAMILITLALAAGLRLAAQPRENYIPTWQLSIFFFLCPPLLLLMTALAILCMGYQGEMLGLPASRLSYILSIVFVSWGLLSLVKLAYRAWQSQQQLRQCSQQSIQGKAARILEVDWLYSAQIGFWQSELVVSRGLIANLDSEHLQAVIAHEQAHYDYRDTFWFFWLGWLRSFTAWLPYTELYWQELLLLRELRADRRAIAQVDALVLAESLLMVAKNILPAPESFCATFSCATPPSRLSVRIDALFTDLEVTPTRSWWSWSWLMLLFLPWATVPLHY